MPIPTTPLAGAAISFSLMLGGAVAAEPELEAGRKIFTETSEPACAICHILADAEAVGKVGPNLDQLEPTLEQVRAAVTSGIGVMPAFSETMSEEEIETVSQYVATAVKDAGKK